MWWTPSLNDTSALCIMQKWQMTVGLTWSLAGHARAVKMRKSTAFSCKWYGQYHREKAVECCCADGLWTSETAICCLVYIIRWQIGYALWTLSSCLEHNRRHCRVILTAQQRRHHDTQCKTVQTLFGVCRICFCIATQSDSWGGCQDSACACLLDGVCHDCVSSCHYVTVSVQHRHWWC